MDKVKFGPPIEGVNLGDKDFTFIYYAPNYDKLDIAIDALKKLKERPAKYWIDKKTGAAFGEAFDVDKFIDETLERLK